MQIVILRIVEFYVLQQRFDSFMYLLRFNLAGWKALPTFDRLMASNNCIVNSCSSRYLFQQPRSKYKQCETITKYIWTYIIKWVFKLPGSAVKYFFRISAVAFANILHSMLRKCTQHGLHASDRINIVFM